MTGIPKCHQQDVMETLLRITYIFLSLIYSNTFYWRFGDIRTCIQTWTHSAPCRSFPVQMQFWLQLKFRAGQRATPPHSTSHRLTAGVACLKSLFSCWQHLPQGVTTTSTRVLLAMIMKGVRFYYRKESFESIIPSVHFARCYLRTSPSPLPSHYPRSCRWQFIFIRIHIISYYSRSLFWKKDYGVEEKIQCDTCVRSFLSISWSVALCQRVVCPGRKKKLSSQRGVIREDRETQTSGYAGGEWLDRMASEKY